MDGTRIAYEGRVQRLLGCVSCYRMIVTGDARLPSWSYGILMYEVFSAGERPYDELQQGECLEFLESGRRLEQPSLCPVDT